MNCDFFHLQYTTNWHYRLYKTVILKIEKVSNEIYIVGSKRNSKVRIKIPTLYKTSPTTTSPHKTQILM